MLWRAKWYILAIFPIVIAGWIYYMIQFGVDPELSATASIGLENAIAMTAVSNKDPGDMGMDKAELIRSRWFLRLTAEKLALNLQVPKYPRNAIIDSLSVDTNAVLGKYTFDTDKQSPDQYIITYSDFRGAVKKKTIAFGRKLTLDTLNLPGIHIQFSGPFLKEQHAFSFYVVDIGSAVEGLRQKLTVLGPGTRSSFFTVSLTGQDYELITSTINAMADAFVEANLSYRTRRTKKTIALLEKQLETASLQLEEAKYSIEAFYAANPSIGFDQNAQKAVSDLISQQSSTLDVQNALDEAQRLRADYIKASGEERIQAMNEILAFLDSKRNPTASVLSMQLARIAQEKEKLEQTYATSHPLIQAARKELENIGHKAFDALGLFLDNNQKVASDNKQVINQLNQKMATLPQKELRLAQLKGNLQGATDIFNSIQTKCNQAKIANAVEVADVYVLDYAVQPVPPPSLINLLQKIAMGLALALALAFGPVILLDMLDKTARTESDLLKLLRIPILESIPPIPSKPIRRPSKRKKHPPALDSERVPLANNEILLTTPAQPQYIGEIFKSLRTKLSYVMHERKDKWLVIVSLNQSEGKSSLSANIAICMAQKGFKTILVDADLRRGTQHRLFGLAQEPGLASLPVHNDMVSPDFKSLIQKTNTPNLSLVACGPETTTPQEALLSQSFAAFRKHLDENFEIIIFDTPPLNVTSDALVLHQDASRFIVTVKAGSTNVIELRKKIDEYPILKKNLAGAILNMAELDSKIKEYKNSKYYHM